MMRVLALAILVAGVLAGPSLAAEPTDYARLSNTALVEALAKLDNQQPGQAYISLGAEFDRAWDAMLASCPPNPPTASQLEAWLKMADARKLYPPRPAGTSSPVVSEIIRRGAPILPELLDHISDKRQTRFLLSSEDPKSEGAWLSGPLFSMIESCFDARRKRPPDCTHTYGFNSVSPTRYAAVGDLAFFLVGQIVNRRYSLTRYQPSSGVIFNSPILTPGLGVAALHDWRGFRTQVALRKQLLADARSTTGGEDRRRGAWLRLRYYFPSDYAALTGADARARDAALSRICAERQPDYPKDS